MHKTADVLNKLPKSVQAKAKSALHAIWMAPTRAETHRAFDAFIEPYKAKYPKAAECLEKERDSLLAFYNFAAAHRQQIRRRIPLNRHSRWCD